jgi:hypothetical protein
VKIVIFSPSTIRTVVVTISILVNRQQSSVAQALDERFVWCFSSLNDFRSIRINRIEHFFAFSSYKTSICFAKIDFVNLTKTWHKLLQVGLIAARRTGRIRGGKPEKKGKEDAI